MKVPINLASVPFRRNRAMLVASIAVCALLVATLAFLGSLIATDRSQMADVRRDVAQLKRQITQETSERAGLNATVNKNSDVLERSLFINTLLARKGISWTRLLGDLEKTLPYNVKVQQIRPWIDSQNRIQLDMVLGSEAAGPAIEALRALQDSPLFGEVLEPTWQPPNPPGEPLYRYRVTVNYAQHL